MAWIIRRRVPLGCRLVVQWDGEGPRAAFLHEAAPAAVLPVSRETPPRFRTDPGAFALPAGLVLDWFLPQSGGRE